MFGTKLLVGAALGFGVVVGMSSPASATPCSLGVCTQTQSVDFVSLSGDMFVTFDGFDGAIGILNAVTVSFTASVTLNDTTTNSSPSAQPVGTQLSIHGTPLTATADVVVYDDLTGSATAILTTAPFNGFAPVNANATFIVQTATDSSLASSVDSFTDPPTDLSPYIGGTNSVSLD